MAAHAILSPSAAHRWLHCTAAPRLEEHLPDSGSDFAREGTLAHAYCAMKLKQALGRNVEEEQAEIDALRDYHTGEMDEYTDEYAAIVMERLAEQQEQTTDATLLVETRLDFSQRIPEAFGTADAIIIADGVMDVIDFKYGKGVKVDAERNPQMMIYALGAYDLFSDEYDIKEVRMTIIQPRLGNISVDTIAAGDLLQWAEDTLAPKAQEAWEGSGAQQPGTWCQFCKAKSRCKALANDAVTISEEYNDPKLLTKTDIETDILPKLATIKNWASAMETYVLERALDGEQYAGWKIVEGRSVRKVSDPAAVREALAALGYDDADIIRPTELRTLTDLEKLVGKKKFADTCGEYIIKPQGKPTLVPESDKRPAMNNPADDFAGME